jgi:hypothetical protein
MGTRHLYWILTGPLFAVHKGRTDQILVVAQAVSQLFNNQLLNEKLLADLEIVFKRQSKQNYILPSLKEGIKLVNPFVYVCLCVLSQLG